MFQTKVVEKIKTHILCSAIFFNHAVYEIMWKNNAEVTRPQMIIWHMHIACWLTKANNTHSEYVVCVAFPLQQWLHECTSIVNVMLYIQGDSGGICSTLGNDGMCDSKPKSSYEHGSDFERLPRYGKKEIRTILRARTAIM